MVRGWKLCLGWIALATGVGAFGGMASAGEPPPKPPKKLTKPFVITLKDPDVFIAFGELAEKTEFEVVIHARDPNIVELRNDRIVNAETNVAMKWKKDEKKSTKKRLVYKGVGNTNTEVKVKVVGEIVKKKKEKGPPEALDFAAAVINVDAGAPTNKYSKALPRRVLKFRGRPLGMDGLLTIWAYTVTSSNPKKLPPGPTWTVQESVTVNSFTITDPRVPETVKKAMEPFLSAHYSKILLPSSTRLGEDVPKRVEPGNVPIGDDQFGDTFAVHLISLFTSKLVLDQVIYVTVPGRGKLLLERNTVTHERKTYGGRISITISAKP